MNIAVFEDGKRYVFRKVLHDLDMPENALAGKCWTEEIDGCEVQEYVRIGRGHIHGKIGNFLVSPNWCEEVSK